MLVIFISHIPYIFMSTELLQELRDRKPRIGYNKLSHFAIMIYMY